MNRQQLLVKRWNEAMLIVFEVHRNVNGPVFGTVKLRCGASGYRIFRRLPTLPPISAGKSPILSVFIAQ
jgi:hypothetical protein